MAASNPAVPSREDCVQRYILERWASETPDNAFIRTSDGQEISYAAFKEQVERAAAGLASLGVKQGDTVTVWLPSGVDVVRIWFAINWLGAVYVPINTAYRGGLLGHVIENAGSRVIVASGSLIERLSEIDRCNLEDVVVIGGDPPRQCPLRVHPADILNRDGLDVPTLQRPIEPWDLQSVIYTSGTTGRSKGVMSSYAHLHELAGDGFPLIDGSDCVLIYSPYFHVGGTMQTTSALLHGGCIALAGEFRTEDFWNAVDATGATFVAFLGVMSSFVAKQPPAADDRNHTLRKVQMIPLDDDWRAFAERFNVQVFTLYNMSELNVPIISEPNPETLGTCGRKRAGVDLRIVDENDYEVPQGQVGELIVRTDQPWKLNSGYFRNPEATAAAWRNGWFHTGDAMRIDEKGNYFFVDRIKDAIRRRGENISSFEVEMEVLAHPGVRECAAIGVKNEISEDDVLAVVAPTPGHTIDAAELLEFLRPRLAHFMLPRYIRILNQLPRTPTQKVEKYRLRAEGVTPDTWDREAAGIRIKRDRITA